MHAWRAFVQKYVRSITEKIDQRLCKCLRTTAVRSLRKSRHSDTAPISRLGRPDRLGDQPYPEHRLAGSVEQFHAPLAVLLQASRYTAEEIGADAPHLAP